MTLIDINKRELAAEGQKEHWALFRAYKNTQVHRSISAKIDELLPTKEDGTVFSGQFGSSVLGEIDFDHVPGAENLSREDIGSLFGMVLWNHLAEAEEHWVLSGKYKDPYRETSTTTYFRLVQ